MFKVVVIICHMANPCIVLEETDASKTYVSREACVQRGKEIFQQVRPSLGPGRGDVEIHCTPVSKGV